MLCEAVCDADRPNQLSETIPHLGLWIHLDSPTKLINQAKNHIPDDLLEIMMELENQHP